MTSQPTAMMRCCALLFQTVLLIFFFIVCAPNNVSGQTLFDLAVEMDSLYNRLKVKDASAAGPFFDVVRKAAKLDPSYPVEELEAQLSQVGLFHESDFASNSYILSKGEEQDSVAIFEAQEDSLVQVVYTLAGIDAKEGMPARMIETGASYEDVLKEMGTDTLSSDTHLEILRLKVDIKLIQDKIASLKGWKSDGPSLSQEEEALNMLPLNTEVLGASTGPIIIQSQTGGSAQSAIIDGAAKWIADRMRQELSIAFFDRFETWAENKNISLLFPNTISVLKSSATTDYSLMMEIYKRAFEKDLNQLTFNIPTFLENEVIDVAGNEQLLTEIAQLNTEINKRDFTSVNGNVDEYNYNSKYGYFARDSVTNLKIGEKSKKISQLNKQQAIKYLNFSLRAVDHLQEGQHPSILLNTLYQQSDELFPQNDRLKSTLLLFNVISQSLTATNAEQNTVWLGNPAISRLRTDAQFRSFYFGLMAFRITTLIDNQLYRQKKITADAMPQETQDKLAKMIEKDSAILLDFVDNMSMHLSTNYIRGMTDFRVSSLLLNYQDRDGSDATINEYCRIKFQNDTLPEIKYKLRRVLNELVYDNYGKFLFDVRQIRKKDNELWNKATAHFRIYDGEAENIFDAGGNLYIDSQLDDPFFLYCYRNPNFETAKNAFLISDFWGSNYYGMVDTLLKPEFKNEKYRAIIDSIQTLRLRNAYDLYEKHLDPDKDAYRYTLRARFESKVKDILQEERIKYVHQLDLKNTDYVRAELKTNQLRTEKQFLRDFILEDKKAFGQLFSSFVQYAGKIDRINAQFKALRSSGQANFGNQEFIYLIKNSMSILDIIFEYSVDQKNPDMVRNMETIQFALDNLLDAYIAGLSEDYNGVVMNIIPVVERLVANKYDKLITPLENELRGSLSEEKRRIGFLPRSPELDSLRLLRDDKLRKMQEVFKYCTFIAAIAKSQGSDDVKKAISAIALPVGSYSVKRRAYANISLNAYPGITGGLELVQNSNVSEWAPNFGFTAPIGIGINWGYRNKISERRYIRNAKYRSRVQKAEVGMDDQIFSGHSGSVFLSVIDLGALVLFRLNDTNEPLPEDVGFKQIFSPGVAYVHGLPRVPISIMAGAQMTPDLRKVGEVGNIESANSFRFNLSFVVDLPIANFYTRRRPK